MSDLRAEAEVLSSFAADEWPREQKRLRSLLGEGWNPQQIVDRIGNEPFEAVAALGRTAGAGLAPLSAAAAAAVTAVASMADNPLPPSVLRTADLVNALASTGQAPGGSLDGAIAGWLSRVRTKRNDPEMVSRHWGLGAAALALGEETTYRRIAGLDIDQQLRFSPKATFGPDVQGLLGYLVAAVEAAASTRDVRPAWSSLLGAYPALLAAGALDSSVLLWIARVIHQRIGGGDLAGTADFLHDSIWQAAGLS